MTMLVDKDAKPDKNPVEREVVGRILKMSPSQKERFLRLVGLYEKADSEQEADEIGEVLYEILLSEAKDYTASKLDTDGSPKGRSALQKHRKYVGEQIRNHRQRLKMSQEQLAQKAGIPQSHVCRLETGKHAPTYLTIEKLAEALGVRASQLDPGFDD